MKLGHDGNGDVVSPPSVPFSSLFSLFDFCVSRQMKKGGGRPTGPPNGGPQKSLPKYGPIAVKLFWGIPIQSQIIIHLVCVTLVTLMFSSCKL